MEPIEFAPLLEAIFAAIGLTSAALALATYFAPAGADDDLAPEPVRIQRSLPTHTHFHTSRRHAL